LGFYPHEAIPMSKFMILFGSFTAFLINLRLKDPHRGTALTNYRIISLMIPLSLLGTMIGVKLNLMTPSWIIILVLTVVLLFNTYRTIKK
jgi:uncharacterized membrane protein YfcA